MNAFVFNLASPAFLKMPTPPAGWQFFNGRTGYPVHLKNETNDCTVRAAQRALRLDYESAHDLLARHGRKPRRGFQFWRVADKARMIRLGVNRGNVESFLKRANPAKRYVIKVRGHVLAACDGIFYDTPKRLRQHVREVWEVSEPTDWVI